jgi:hypothetical protein
MRTPIVAGLVVSVIAVPAAAEPGNGPRRVNLNSSHELAQLAASNPGEFRKVAAIVQRLETFGSGEWRKIETDFQATNGFSSPILLTTFPPQTEVSFTLGNTTYHGWTNLGLRAQLKTLETKP